MAESTLPPFVALSMSSLSTTGQIGSLQSPATLLELVTLISQTVQATMAAEQAQMQLPPLVPLFPVPGVVTQGQGSLSAFPSMASSAPQMQVSGRPVSLIVDFPLCLCSPVLSTRTISLSTAHILAGASSNLQC